MIWKRWRRRVQDRRTQFESRFPLEWQSTRRHFVEHDTKRPESVRASAGSRAKQLGAMYGSVPATVPRVRAPCRLGQLADTLERRVTREPEVENLDPSLRCHHHIAALQIAMNEAVRMRVRERLCDLAPVLEQIFKRQRVPAITRSGSGRSRAPSRSRSCHPMTPDFVDRAELG